MNRGLALVGLVAASLTAVSATATAQNVAPPGFGVGIDAGVITLSPEADQREWGGAVEGAVRYTWASGFQVLAGGTYGFAGVKDISENRTLWGLFADGRLLLSMGAQSVVPWVGGRVGYVSQSLNVEELPNNQGRGEFRGTGWSASGLVGMLARLSDQLAFEAYLAFGVAPFGDVELNGEKLPDTSNTDFTASLKIGLVYSFGG
jgi:hypothetical protein